MRQKTARARLTATVAVLAALASLIVVPRYLVGGTAAGASDGSSTASDTSAYDLTGTPATVSGWQDAMADLAYAAAAPPGGFDASTLYDLPAETAQAAQITWIDGPTKAGACPQTLVTCYANSAYGVGLRPGDSTNPTATAYVYRVNGVQPPTLYPITSSAYGWDGAGHARIVFAASNWPGFGAVAARSNTTDLSPMFPSLKNQSAPPDYSSSGAAGTAQHPVYRMADNYAHTVPTSAQRYCPVACYQLLIGTVLIGYLSVTPDFVILLPTDGTAPTVVRHADLAYQRRGADTATYSPLMRFTLPNGAAFALPASGDPVGEALASDVYFPASGSLSAVTDDAQLAAYQTQRAPWPGSIVSSAEFDFRSNLGLDTSSLQVKDDYTKAQLPPALIPVDLADSKSLLDDGGQFLYLISSSDPATSPASRVATTAPSPPLNRDPSVSAVATGFAPLVTAADGSPVYRPVLAVQRGQRADSITLYDLSSRGADQALVQALSTRLTQTHVYLPPPSPPTTRNAANSSWIDGTQSTAFVGTKAATDPSLFTPTTAWTAVDGEHTQIADTTGAEHPVHVGGFGTYQQVDSAGNPIGDAIAVFAAQDDDGNLYLMPQSAGAPAAAAQEISANAAHLIAAGTAAHEVSEGAADDLFALYTSASHFGGVPAGSGRSLAALSSSALGLVQTGTRLPTSNGGRAVLSPLEAQRLFAPEQHLTDALGSAMNNETVAADLRMLLAHEAAIAASQDAPVHDDDVKVTASGGGAPSITDPVDLAMARLAAVAIVDATRLQSNATNDPATYNVVLALLHNHFPQATQDRTIDAVRLAYQMLGIDANNYDANVILGRAGVTQAVYDQRAALDPDVRTGYYRKSCGLGPHYPLGALIALKQDNDPDCSLLGGPVDTGHGLALLSQDSVTTGRLASTRLAQFAVQQDFTDLMALGNQVPAFSALAGKVAGSQKSILSLLSGIDPDLAASVVSRLSNSAERDAFATETITSDDIAAAVSLMPYLLATVVRLGDRMIAYAGLTATNAAEMLRVVNTPGYLNAVSVAITGQLPRLTTAGGLAEIDFESVFKDVAAQPAFREVPIVTAFNNMGGFGTISGVMVLAILAAKYANQPVVTWQDQLSIVGAIFTFVSYASHYIKTYATLKGLLSATSTVQTELTKIGTTWGGFRDVLASINVAGSNDITRVERIAYVLLRKKKQNGSVSLADIKNAFASHFYTGDMDGAAADVYRRITTQPTLDARTSFEDVVEASRSQSLGSPTRLSSIDFESAATILSGNAELREEFLHTPDSWRVRDQASLSTYLQEHLSIGTETADAFARDLKDAAQAARGDEPLERILQAAAATTRHELADTISESASGKEADASLHSDLVSLQSDEAPQRVIADDASFQQRVSDIADPNMSEAGKDALVTRTAEAEWDTLFQAVRDQVWSFDGQAPRLSFNAVAARAASALSHVIVLGDLGSGIVSMILAIDLMRNGDYAAGAANIVFATLYIVASILEAFGIGAFEFGGFLLAIIAAIISLILQMLPPDPSKDRGALFDWAKPYADAGLLADPAPGPTNVSITALQYWHEHNQNPTGPFPTCTSTDLGSCTNNPQNAPKRGCLVNAADATSLALAYGGTEHVGGVYVRTRHSGCDASDNQVLVFPELGGDVVRVIAPGTTSQYPGDYSLASGSGGGAQAGNFYFSSPFEPDATTNIAEWIRHDLGNGAFQLESRATAGQCLASTGITTCNRSDPSQQWTVK